MLLVRTISTIVIVLVFDHVSVIVIALTVISIIANVIVVLISMLLLIFNCYCYWLRHDVNAQNRHAVCIGFYSVSYSRSAFRVGAVVVSCVCNSWFLRRPESSVLVAFPCLRVLNISEYTVVPLFGRLFAGVRGGIERLHGVCGLSRCGKGVCLGGSGRRGGWGLFRVSLPSHFFAIDVHRHI